MSVHGQSQSVRAERFDRVDPVWQRLREEAEDRDPPRRRTGRVHLCGDPQPRTRSNAAVVHRVAARLAPRCLAGRSHRAGLRGGDRGAIPTIGGGLPRRHHGRGRPRPCLPARCIEPVLYFKGFHAIQTHRLAHCAVGPRAARISRSISRAARPRCSRPTSILRRGSAGASSSTMRPASSSARPRSIEDNVSMLQDVTLGRHRQGARRPAPEGPARAC